jgi:hypothetical protein
MRHTLQESREAARLRVSISHSLMTSKDDLQHTLAAICDAGEWECLKVCWSSVRAASNLQPRKGTHFVSQAVRMILCSWQATYESKREKIFVQ